MKEGTSSGVWGRRIAKWLRHPTGRFVIAASLILGGYQAYGYLTGPSRITPRLQARIAQNGGPVNIGVTTEFPPEEFHIQIYQNLGSIRGVEGTTTRLFEVTPANIRYLSRYYWIERIDLLEAAPSAKKRTP